MSTRQARSYPSMRQRWSWAANRWIQPNNSFLRWWFPNPSQCYPRMVSTASEANLLSRLQKSGGQIFARTFLREESFSADREFAWGQIFAAWGNSIRRGSLFQLQHSLSFSLMFAACWNEAQMLLLDHTQREREVVRLNLTSILKTCPAFMTPTAWNKNNLR